MKRILSLVCGLALAAPAAAQDRSAQPRPTPDRPKAESARDLQAEVERLRAQLRELEGRLAKQKDGDRRPDGPPKGEGRGPAPREVAPMPRPKDGERGPAPKDAGPMGGRGFGPPGFGGPGGGGFGKGGFGPGGFPPFGGPGMKDGGPKGPGFGGAFPQPFAQGRGPGSPGAAPADFEQRLNRIIDELERLRDDLHRGPKR
jgi:hypothetical protein